MLQTEKTNVCVEKNVPCGRIQSSINIPQLTSYNAIRNIDNTFFSRVRLGEENSDFTLPSSEL